MVACLGLAAIGVSTVLMVGSVGTLGPPPRKLRGA